MDAAPPRLDPNGLSLDQARAHGRKTTLRQAGEAFESLFMQTIMKSMRSAQLDGGLFDTEAEKPFQSMLDQAYADLAARRMKLGLADALERQFAPPKRAAEAPPMAPRTE